MTISYSHIAALTKAAKTGKQVPISASDSSSISFLPGFVADSDLDTGHIMHRPSASAERVKVLLGRKDGRYFVKVSK